MLSVNIVFIVVAVIAFLGFILNALFDRLRITSILPLMLIGLAIGPVFHIVSTSTGSVVSELTPYITALTVAFILFDVGINMDVAELGRVIRKATKFMLSLALLTGVACGLLAFAVFSVVYGWNLLDALIFGFAIAGPSTIIVPTLVKLVRLPDDLKNTLLYEGVTSDAVQLVVPSILLGLLAASNVTAGYVADLLIGSIVGSVILGVISALFWLRVMNKFSDYSEGYGWTLTITMIIATYGLAQQLGMSGLFAVFVFGIAFANVGSYKRSSEYIARNEWAARVVIGTVSRYFSIGGTMVGHIRSYQREIVFFTSTFFFVYIGLLFSITQLGAVDLLAAAMFTALILFLRSLAAPMLNGFMTKDDRAMAAETGVVSVNVGRGLSPAVVATLPLALGIQIPGLLDLIFLVILFTNILSSVLLFFIYRPPKRRAQVDGATIATAGA